MQIIVRGHGIEVTQFLRDYVYEKVTKVEQYFSNIQKVEVTLDSRDIDDANRRNVAEVTMWMAGKKEIRASEGAIDMYAAIDLVMKEVERQVKKHKDMHLKEKRREGAKIKEERAARTEVLTEKKPAIIKTSRIMPKPMSVEDVKEELKLSHENFMVFVNSKTHAINVVHKTGGDGFEHLEADKAEVDSFSQDGAVEKLSLMNKNFLIFKNAETGQINVMFRRGTGNYGLIEPGF